jgi:hypothetical protein
MGDTRDTDLLDADLVEFEGPSDKNPEPMSEASLKRLELLREFYRQSARQTSNGAGSLDTPKAT